MLSTVINSLGIAVVAAVLNASAVAAESNRVPKSVYAPVLHLRLPIATAKLELISEEIRAMCIQMADNESWTGQQWVFGVTKYRETTYYLVNGYFKRRNPKSSEHMYLQPDDGGVYRISDNKCEGDQARETFDVRDPKQIPREVLQQLADDLVIRLARAVGSKDRLRTEITTQHIKFETLSPEMQVAFKPYFASVK
jgi:hypothetical protein